MAKYLHYLNHHGGSLLSSTYIRILACMIPGVRAARGGEKDSLPDPRQPRLPRPQMKSLCCFWPHPSIPQSQQSKFTICLSWMCIKLEDLEPSKMPAGALKKDLGVNQDRKNVR